MRVEILKPVPIRGEIQRAGIFDVPDRVAQHWIDTGAAKLPNPPAQPATAAKSGEKPRY